MSRDFYKCALDLRDENHWDNKDWSRHIDVPQRLLEQLDAGELPDDDVILEELIKATNKEQKSGKERTMLRFKKPAVIASCTHKGGCGKTTCCIGIADALSSQGYNVLVIDSDSQMDATSTLLRNSEDAVSKAERFNLFSVLAAGTDFRQCIQETDYDRLDIVPSSMKMASAETMLTSQAAVSPNVEMVFRDALKPLVEENYYDFIFIDMDKTAGFLNRVFLNGCSFLLMTSECSIFNVTGAAVMKEQYDNIKAKSNSELELLGIILNKVTKRKAIVSAAIEEFDEIMPGKRFENVVRMDANVEKAQWQHVTLRAYNSRSGAWLDMLAVTDEIIGRLSRWGREE